MDYEKKYNEALNRAREEYKTHESFNGFRVMLLNIFPELEESEDEKIRKTLIRFFNDQYSNETKMYDGTVTVGKALAWLEKQGDKDKLIQELGKYKVKYTQEVLGQYINSMSNKDEDIRKEIVALIEWSKSYAASGITNNEAEKMLAWVEKQGEQKQDPCEHCKDKCLNCHNFPCIDKRRFEQGKTVIEAITEETVDNANKVEPRFKDGEWIVYKDAVWKVCNISLQNYYELLKTNNEVSTRLIEDVDENAHLWSIADAKDGDVLATESWLYLFKYTNNKNIIQFHCTCPINVNPLEWYFSFDESYLDIYIDANIRPASKEQRDLLFAKMREAGYEWDGVKKELKEIEQNSTDNANKLEPKFKVGDWIIQEYVGVFKVIEICKSWYEVIDDEDNHYSISFDKEGMCHLWTVADAKDGDVLASDNGVIILVKESRDSSWGYRLSYHCAVLHDGTFEPREFHVNPEKFFPASKEQHDALMKAIADAGYVWHSESKELIKQIRRIW